MQYSVLSLRGVDGEDEGSVPESDLLRRLIL